MKHKVVMKSSKDVLQNMICILFARGTSLADDIRDSAGELDNLDLVGSITPGHDDWFSNMAYTIYLQMYFAIREDPASFAEMLERTHLDSTNGTVVVASMNAIRHFGPLLYGSNKVFGKAIAGRVKQLLNEKGERLQ